MKRSPVFQLGLQGKMLGAFTFSAAATLVVALVGFFAIRSLTSTLAEIGHRRMIASQEMLVASSKIGDLETLLREALSYTITAKERASLDESISAARADYRAAASRAKPLLDEDERTKLEIFAAQTKEWATTNDQIRGQLKLLSEKNIDAPLTLQTQLDGFRADHLQLMANAQNHLRNGTSYEGDSDPTVCRFGRWLASYKTDSKIISEAVQRAIEPHKKLHEAVHELQERLAAGKKDEGQRIVESVQVQSVEATVAMLKELQTEPASAVATLDDLHRTLRDASVPQSQKALATLDTIVKDVNAQSAEAVAAADHLGSTAKTVSLVVLIVGTLSALLLGLYVARNIAVRLRSVAADLDGASNQTASVATQITTTSQNVANSASEQASSLEETSAALEELSGTTAQNAERARSATARAAAARASAEHGTGQMQELQTAMNSIQESSAEITKIVKTIDEIAFQTNLLALNAAVEAARAGEAGAGFAVVADEVRSLAHRAAAAAKETTSLVEDARNRSQRGANLAVEVSKNLDEILKETRSVDSLVEGIASSSAEQNTGVDQIKKAAAQLDQLVQSNAANAEENASAAEELKWQTVSMHDMVGSLLQVVNGRHESEVEDLVQASAPNASRAQDKKRLDEAKATTRKARSVAVA